MRIFIKMLISLFLSFSLFLPGFATEIPKPIMSYIKSKFPKATVRFDGVIELPDRTMYLPVLPFSYAEVTNPAEITMTLPEKTSLSSKPDLIVFANNLSLLKVVKKEDGTRTLINSSKIPLKVKLGMLPQDLVVPENLVIPLSLRVIIGDLKIPISGEHTAVNNDNDLGTEGKIPGNVKVSNVTPAFPELKDLVNKTFYATNIQSNLLYILFPQTGRPIKTIQLSSIPSDIAITGDNRYVLVTCLSSNTVSIIDAANNSFVSEIEVGKMPVSIVVPRGSDKAYVANRASSNISVIDLKDMEVIKEFPVIGYPSNLVVSEDKRYLFYYDPISMKAYKMSIVGIGDELNPDNKDLGKVIPVTQANNASKLLLFDKYLFILSRSDDSLIVYDLELNKVANTVKVGNKPVDMQVNKENNKLYVLSAGANDVEVIDLSNFAVVNKITLKESGFFKSINILSSVDKALVSNVDSYEVAIIDLNKEKIIDYLPVGTTINSLLIMQQVK